MTPPRDKFGDIIPPDFLGSGPEDVASYAALEASCHELGFIEYERDADGEILLDVRGCNRWVLHLPEPEMPLVTVLGGQTIGDRVGPPRDAADEALAKLPALATKRQQAAALLLAGLTGAEIHAKIRVSHSTICQARALVLQEQDERVARGESPAPLPETILNPGGYARRGRPRHDMRADSGTNPMQLRAQNLGVSEAMARQIATDNRNKTKFGEHEGPPKRRTTRK